MYKVEIINEWFDIIFVFLMFEDEFWLIKRLEIGKCISNLNVSLFYEIKLK